MVLTNNGIALPLLFGSGILNKHSTILLVGSEFPEDKTELFLIKQVNLIKLAMLNGQVVVLLNHDNIYEALYDVLNQRYVTKTDSTTGRVIRMLRLAIGSRSQLCQVEEGFKIIVVTEQMHAYTKLDLPLLNRFEKQVLKSYDLLTPDLILLLEEIQGWVEEILSHVHSDGIYDVFCGMHSGTLASLVLTIASGESPQELTPLEPRKILERSKLCLLQIATPVAVIHSQILEGLGEKKQLLQHACRSFCLNQPLLFPNPSRYGDARYHDPLPLYGT